MSPGTSAPAPAGARWGRMAARLARTLGRHGLDDDGVARVLEAHGRAGVHRATLLPPDEDDPRWLHPGRNVVILLEDAEVSDPGWLALGAGVDLAHPHLMEPGVREGLAARELCLPGAGSADAEWLAELVTMDRPALCVVLADALDRARHLHLEPASGERASEAERVCRLFLPLSERVGGTLARRFRWWCARVAPALAAPQHFDSC
jgi:hypothetical protein